MLGKHEYKSIDNKYIILKNIGEGIYGQVFLVYEKNVEKQKYAAKVLFKKDKYFDCKIEIIKKIKKLKSPYIINFITSSDKGILKGIDNGDIIKQYAIYEYASKKTIFEYLIFSNPIFEEKYAKIIFKYLLKGFQAMHNIGICHRDIKLGNILLDENFKPKICDFGFVTECKDIKLKGKCGSKSYCSPEIIRKKGFEPYDGIKADIFSLGAILLYMVIGNQRNSDEDFIKYKEEYNFDSYLNKLKTHISNTSKEFQKLIIKMIDFNPEKRPSIENILDDPWMKEVKEDDLKQEKEIFKEFKRREEIIKENRISNVIDKKNLCDKSYVRNKSIIKDYIDYFKQEFEIKNISESKIELRDYLFINGNIPQLQFMNYITNCLQNEIQDGFINANKDYYIIDVKFEYEEEEEENEEDLNENEEKNCIDYNFGINKKDLLIQIILFESENENHLLQFYKKSGEIEDYYQKLENIISIIKKSLELI